MATVAAGGREEEAAALALQPPMAMATPMGTMAEAAEAGAEAEAGREAEAVVMPALRLVARHGLVKASEVPLTTLTLMPRGLVLTRYCMAATALTRRSLTLCDC